MRKIILIFFIALQSGSLYAQQAKTPDQIYGQLFVDVQMQNVLKDGKTFVDCEPKRSPKLILQDYIRLRKSKGFSLKDFVANNFVFPDTNTTVAVTTNQSVVQHINDLWTGLERVPSGKVANSSLLNLPYPYIVPGGRFREIYYWDSYFTMLGLKASGKDEVIENMIRNFAALIRQYGHIPNGNRNYYLSRSQPPFFALMIDLLAQIKNKEVYITYLPYLEKEYAYWMDKSAATKHVMTMPDGSLLNRYYDQLNIPRQESYKEDVLSAGEAGNQNPGLYRDIRSAAESGWDFSSRWFSDGTQLKTIQTTQIIPVDLNCLLYHLESTLQKSYAAKHNTAKEKLYRNLAQKRKQSIQKYFWSARDQWYTDYNYKTKQKSAVLSLAGMFPLFFNIADQKQAQLSKVTLEQKFLRAGGLSTTLHNTHQQWDAPNGWAPLQWISVTGLENYGYSDLAKNIAIRWVDLNTRVYRSTGKLMEKYNVVDIHLTAGGGEYTSQDGFGWTNGVLLGLIRKYNLPE
ncbi:alpha,alpha-trehalase [Pedobacter westerhofensis]|uniref:Alpha,alpha-trehalase n=1 Tax=Pedobacter westerhofensis TaxID=425512 RepID=A0A521CDD2_9SPHI|nr:alpha,alpha-trehalase TreF [Pedobacter westerhofensis]SMO57436.1 alpha,alpha-trehalase [Pedobacter westerhofensis]